MKKQLDSLDRDTIRQVDSACKEIARNCELLTIVNQDLDTIYKTTRRVCRQAPIYTTSPSNYIRKLGNWGCALYSADEAPQRSLLQSHGFDIEQQYELKGEEELQLCIP